MTLYIPLCVCVCVHICLCIYICVYTCIFICMLEHKKCIKINKQTKAPPEVKKENDFQ